MSRDTSDTNVQHVIKYLMCNVAVSNSADPVFVHIKHFANAELSETYTLLIRR